MTTYRIREVAAHDLESIGVVSRREFGDERMRKYLTEIVHTFDSLGAVPGLGRACDEIFEGCRRFPVGSHVIFYELGKDGVVEIVRVLHGHMQHDLHFPDE